MNGYFLELDISQETESPKNKNCLHLLTIYFNLLGLYDNTCNTYDTLCVHYIRCKPFLKRFVTCVCALENHSIRLFSSNQQHRQVYNENTRRNIYINNLKVKLI